MNSGPIAKEPPRPKTILATPLNVEESRAQRQQRSQARFRDRGGIFVPSNRNTLADILLGKAEPLKKPRRSVSASPLGRLHKGPAATHLKRISSPTKRNASAGRRSTSPLKQSQKPNRSGDGEGGVVRKQSPQKPVASTSIAKPKAKTPSKPTKSTAWKVHSEDKSDAPLKPKAKPKSKASAKSTKAPADVNEEMNVPPKPKGKVSAREKAKTKEPPKPIDPVEKPKPKPKKPPKSSKVAVSEAPPAESTSSSARKGVSKPRRSRGKTSDIYSFESEDEYVPKPSKASAKSKPKPKVQAPAKASTSDKAESTTNTTPKPSGRLSAIMEEEEEEDALPPRNISPPPTKVSKVSESHTAKESAKKAESTKSKNPSTHAVSDDNQSMKIVVKPVKSTEASRKKSDTVPKDKTKGSIPSGKTAKGKKRTIEEDEVEIDVDRHPVKRTKVLDTKRAAEPAQKSRTKSSTLAKGKKRGDPEDEPADDPVQRPQKPSKTSTADNASTLIASVKPSKKSEVQAAKKRPREHDDSAPDPEKADTRSMKRKKPSSEDVSIPKAAKASAKSTKGNSRSKKPPSKAGKPASSKAMESASKATAPGTSKSVAMAKRGPPKSVLARLKENDKHHISDSDPDPIDFLS